MITRPSMESSSSSKAKARKYTTASQRKMKSPTTKLATALTTSFLLTSGRGANAKRALRVFQTLPHELNKMNKAEMMRSIRATQAMVFGGEDDANELSLHLDIYTPSERREYLVKRGSRCHPTNMRSFNGMDEGKKEDEQSFGVWYDVLSRYDSLLGSGRDEAPHSFELERMAIELWKYCVLYNGDGHVYLDYEGSLLRPVNHLLSNLEGNVAIITQDSTGGSTNSADKTGGDYIHTSFLAISPYSPATYELGAMIRLLLETSDEMLSHSPLLLPRELHRMIVGRVDQTLNSNVEEKNGQGENGENDVDNTSATWTLWRNHCMEMANPSSEDSMATNFFTTSSSFTLLGWGAATPDAYARRTAARCPLSEGGYCCLAFLEDAPVMALRHPVGGWDVSSKLGLPYSLDPTGKGNVINVELKLGGVPEGDLPYISTVRLVKNDTEAMDGSPYSPSMATAETPNFFDILFENDCLPYRKECHRCLKDVANEAPSPDKDGSTTALVTTNACSKCKSECPCYCDILCKVRPPPKKVVRTYAVHPPRYKKEVDRLVPKIIHQTWFEPVTQDKYPNMSRLIESWKKSGWEYYFYDDGTAGEFLSTHFPPEVREAYESITPGAFKADLFRYCVLLIRGGVYADMDVLLETNLDDAIASDIGFMTPIDEPGTDVGHRSCLWNGLIASAPGHPFLARTIEIVVNNIRNRFTAVDYDDMLCPNPILSVSHTVDTLFTCGPCILGAGINNIIGRHMQHEFEIGDVDIWQNERKETQKNDPDLSDNSIVSVSSDDPRLLIPGRTVILEQNKNDMGAHRFTWADRHLIIAATDMPDYDDRPPSKEHYSKTHEKAGVYGMRKLYTDSKRANEEIRITVEKV
ncbi:hypothetical protein HJC23_013392 [Cyclotella cryptica]|uniref:Glycosyltransferase family 32 protein n=1 Tax=Cyclotella cryptica TaxID=29204 RepID=A0ABD3PVU1_9STRA|eukprot:CCRYP_010951-RA/>CCRYP_010951-RA protein AED:0.04 eAED:0.04 QI:291/1/1/1/0.8/0.66/6/228/865